jgi:hypothetical protein
MKRVAFRLIVNFDIFIWRLSRTLSLKLALGLLPRLRLEKACSGPTPSPRYGLFTRTRTCGTPILD